ncbi:MAG: helix-turn-helix transcriptional regulator, partial [Firmicutes bacterium]|nr:helix-turn-helix transcriptional regulator [Bacillota bacterium]
MELGKKIRQLRFRAGLTQEQLAEKLGIGAQAVSKWENAASMPDITALPLLAEIFGVSIDDLFDLTSEQRLNRIENRLDTEEDLPQDLFVEYEAFLKGQLGEAQHKKRATGLMAYLYWHRMESYARKASRYAREAVQAAPNEKD